MNLRPESQHLDHIWSLVVNEARLHSERTNFFLVANSFLVTGFALLRQEPALGIQFVPLSLGIAFTLLHLININYGESVLQLWERTLETKSEAGSAILSARDDMFKGT